jgi:hypothetical protein
VRSEDADIRLVSAADKLYNVREILADLRQHGESVWERFKGGREGSLWYYRSLVQKPSARVAPCRWLTNWTALWPDWKPWLPPVGKVLPLSDR